MVKQQANPGVEKRAEKDEVGREERRMDVSNVQASLVQKAAIYDEAMKHKQKGGHQLLVDFD